MSISHRTNRLKLVSAPTVEQLQNGRFRLTFNARPLNPRESWYNANKNRIFAAFGTLQDAEMSIDGIGARTGATYTDMRLVDARTIPDGESYLVQFTYETIGSSFVQVKDDTISFTESGLRRVQRESIAAAGTAFSQIVGTTTINHQINAETAVACRLAAFEINDTDSSRTVVATYVEEGTLSRTEDFVGSQKAIVIEAIGPDPSTPSDYSLASKEESNFEGLQTNRFTFLKDNVVLSESEDKVGSQKAIVKEVFNGTPATPEGYSIASEESSDVGGIATKRFTFLKNGAVLSSTTEERQSGPNATGKVRIQTVEVFNGTPASTIGGVQISEEQSNVGAIVTTRAVFATGLGEVSRSTETRNNGKLTITTVENLGSAGSASGVEIEATSREENGFTLFRNVFALGQGEISRSTEKRNKGKLTVTTVESLGIAGTATGTEIEATTREENGYTIFKNVFANGIGEISRSTETRNKGSLTITTVESLGSEGTAGGVEIEATSREENGFTLFRNVFADGSGEVSRTVEKRNKGKLIITTVEALGTAGSATGVEIEATTREENGFTLFRNVFADGAGEVSRSTETRNKGALVITTVEALGSAGTAGGVEIEATTREEDGFTLFRNVFANGSGEVSRSTETRNNGKLTIITIESLGSAGSATGVEVEATTREQDGYTLFRNVFANGSGEVSRTVEKRNKDKLTITTVESLGSKVDAPGDVELESTERQENGFTLFRSVKATGTGEISRTTQKRNRDKLTITTVESLGSKIDAPGDVELESTERQENGFTLFRSVKATGTGEISRNEDLVGSQKAIVIEHLGDSSVTAPAGDYEKAQEDVSDINNVVRKRVTFLLKNAELSKQTDKLGALEVIVKEVFNPTIAITESGFTEISREDSNVGGIKTQRVTFYKDNAIISESFDFVGSQKSVVIKKFKVAPTIDEAGRFGGDNYEVAKKEEEGKAGVKIFNYTFLRKNCVLSRTVEQKQSGILPEGQNRLTIEVVDVFQPDDGNGLTYTTIGATRFISEETSSVEGIKTKRFRFVVATNQSNETEVSRTTTSADPGLPATCKEVTEVHVSEPIPTAPPNNGRLIRESVQQQDGYELHTRTYLEGEIAGTTTEYEDYIEVEIPGEVTLEEESVSSGGVSGTIAIVKVQPKRIERKKANIKVEVIKDEGSGIPAIGEIAYDLGKISCSVTATNIQRSIGPGSTVTIGAGTNNINSDTGFVSDFKVQTNVTNYPGHFIKGEKQKEGTINYISSSQPVASGNAITRQEESVDRVTKLVATGTDDSEKSSSYKETGVISRKVRPILIDINQGSSAKYYEVITTTIGLV